MEQLLITLPVLIFSVVLHEVAHAWVARSQGDHTAAAQGRITLNPIPHLDPLGSVLLPGIMAIMGGPILGWARPVPVDPRNFRNYKRGDILVSLAGVAVNFLLAILFTLLLAAVFAAFRGFPGFAATWELLAKMFYLGIGLNFLLVLFNLLPIPPLDGSHVLFHLLPVRMAIQYQRLGQYGMFVLFALLFVGGLNFLIIPVGALTGAAVGVAQALGGG